MSENQNKQKKIKDIFTYVKVVRAEAKKEIQRIKSAKQNNPKDVQKIIITRAEQNIIIEEVAKRPSTKIKVARALVAGMILGAGGATLANNMIDAPKGIEQNKEEITIDMSEVDKDINIVNTNDKTKIFFDDIKYPVDTSEIINRLNSKEQEEKEIQKLKVDVIEEVDNLETPEDVLKYIKDIYLEEYNEKNNSKFTTDDVRINRRTEQFVMYTDQAKNGDEIIRETHKEQYEEKGNPGKKIDSQRGEIYAVLSNEEETKKEAITLYNGGYKTVYADNEEVLEDKETVLASVGDIFDNGIQYCNALRNPDGNSQAIIGLYRSRLIESVVEYKESKAKETINGNIYNITQRNIDDDQEVE